MRINFNSKISEQVAIFDFTAGRIPVKLTDSADRPFWELADVVVILFGPKVKTRFKNLVLCSRHHLIFFSSVACLLTLHPKSDLKILLCITSDDFTRERETP